MGMGHQICNVGVTAVVVIFVGVVDGTVKIFHAEGYAGKVVIFQYRDAYQRIALSGQYAAEAASSDNYWKGQDRYSNDLLWLKNEAGVNVYRTPQSIMDEQLKAWDMVLPELEKDPFFAKVVKSYKDFAKRVAYYELMNSADYKLAYEHYFPGELGF